MKKSSIYISIAFLLGAMVFIGCQEERVYPELVLGKSTAPVATLALIADSLNETYTYATLSSTMDGEIYYVVLAQGSAAPTATEIVLAETDPAATSIDVVAGSSYTVKLKNLASAESYDVYAVATNAEEGKPSAVVGPASFSCLDLTAPYIVEMDPANASEKVSAALEAIVLTMSENVTVADASLITLVDAFDETDLGIKGAVTADGSTVTIEITDSIPFLTEVAVLIEAGAFVDAEGLTSPEYIADATYYLLTFIVEDMIDMSVFNGAYHCEANEVGFGDGIKEYDVIMKGAGSSASGYYISIQNINNWVGSLVYLDIDPYVDTCFIADQATGMVYGGTEDVYIMSTDEYALAGVDFKPGNFKRDGSEVRVFGEIYMSLGYFGMYEFTFTKIAMSEAKINYLPPVFGTPRMKK